MICRFRISFFIRFRSSVSNRALDCRTFPGQKESMEWWVLWEEPGFHSICCNAGKQHPSGFFLTVNRCRRFSAMKILWLLICPKFWLLTSTQWWSPQPSEYLEDHCSKLPCENPVIILAWFCFPPFSRVLCETVKDFVARVGKAYEKATESSEESEVMARKVNFEKMFRFLLLRCKTALFSDNWDSSSSVCTKRMSYTGNC